MQNPQKLISATEARTAITHTTNTADTSLESLHNFLSCHEWNYKRELRQRNLNSNSLSNNDLSRDNSGTSTREQSRNRVDKNDKGDKNGEENGDKSSQFVDQFSRLKGNLALIKLSKSLRNDLGTASTPPDPSESIKKQIHQKISDLSENLLKIQKEILSGSKPDDNDLLLLKYNLALAYFLNNCPNLAYKTLKNIVKKCESVYKKMVEEIGFIKVAAGNLSSGVATATPKNAKNDQKSNKSTKDKDKEKQNSKIKFYENLLTTTEKHRDRDTELDLSYLNTTEFKLLIEKSKQLMCEALLEVDDLTTCKDYVAAGVKEMDEMEMEMAEVDGTWFGVGNGLEMKWMIQEMNDSGASDQNHPTPPHHQLPLGPQHPTNHQLQLHQQPPSRSPQHLRPIPTQGRC